MSTLLHEIVNRIVARQNCRNSNNAEWLEKHGEELHRLCKMLPSGSGIDSGTKLDEDKSGEYRLVLTCGFHHMNDGGYYDGWTQHTISVTPNFLSGFTIRIGGSNRNDIKDYLAEVFTAALSEEIKPI